MSSNLGIDTVSQEIGVKVISMNIAMGVEEIR